jgi:hypothetical protein
VEIKRRGYRARARSFATFQAILFLIGQAAWLLVDATKLRSIICTTLFLNAKAALLPSIP